MSRFPLPLRLLNLAGRGASAVGLHPVNLQFDNLLRSARKNTGLQDFGEDDFEAPLRMLLDGLENEARLSLLGRMIARADLLRTLQNRLGIVDLLKRHPEITEQPVDRPMFVVGPPRSGTTIFHDLLARDPDNRVPQSWEVSYPLPPPQSASYDSDPRIARCQADLDRVDQFIPEFKQMHPMGAQRAQECVAFMSLDITSMIFYVQFNVPTYDHWVMQHDMASAFRWHRRFLQVLQWRCPGVRWALKSPQHMWHLEYVHREYPDALFVQTHRDPVKTVISMSNLTRVLQGLASEHVDMAAISRHYAEGLAMGYDNTVAYRRSGGIPEAQIVDLYFRDFMQDQVGTVRRAYRHFGFELGDEAARRMQAFLDANPADKHGKHLYELADTGLELDYLRDIFSNYEQYFAIPREET
ncbi:MAG: sulfotransferase [Halioglobus sp.]|nr:sulfotransferase [Halioglobus sp.]|tara:strand:+ start:1425 stop:2660 length:1236 start_codon:yes stop_codon:yes gene_type:complete